MRKNNLKTIVNFLYEVGTAKNIVRSHHQVINWSNDTIASHSFRVAIIGLILAEMEKADQDKVVKMCLLHDLAELRTGDANFVNKFYRVESEEKAIYDQWKEIVGGKKIIFLLKEYNKKKSKEAIIAKDADILDQIFLQKEYLSHRPYDFKKWHTNHEKKLKTKSGLKIARLVLKTEIMDWVYELGGLIKKNKK
jgi:putative hydrolase of HD superfamily